eukprot:5808216-Amphidinium_carterae.1
MLGSNGSAACDGWATRGAVPEAEVNHQFQMLGVCSGNAISLDEEVKTGEADCDGQLFDWALLEVAEDARKQEVSAHVTLQGMTTDSASFANSSLSYSECANEEVAGPLLATRLRARFPTTTTVQLGVLRIRGLHGWRSPAMGLPRRQSPRRKRVNRIHTPRALVARWRRMRAMTRLSKACTHAHEDKGLRGRDRQELAEKAAANLDALLKFRCCSEQELASIRDLKSVQTATGGTEGPMIEQKNIDRSDQTATGGTEGPMIEQKNIDRSDQTATEGTEGPLSAVGRITTRHTLGDGNCTWRSLFHMGGHREPNWKRFKKQCLALLEVKDRQPLAVYAAHAGVTAYVLASTYTRTAIMAWSGNTCCEVVPKEWNGLQPFYLRVKDGHAEPMTMEGDKLEWKSLGAATEHPGHEQGVFSAGGLPRQWRAADGASQHTHQLTTEGNALIKVYVQGETVPRKVRWPAGQALEQVEDDVTEHLGVDPAWIRCVWRLDKRTLCASKEVVQPGLSLEIASTAAWPVVTRRDADELASLLQRVVLAKPQRRGVDAEVSGAAYFARGILKKTQIQIQVVQDINAWLKRRLPGAVWTALAVLSEGEIASHRDVRNRPGRTSILLAPKGGTMLWCDTRIGTDQLEEYIEQKNGRRVRGTYMGTNVDPSQFVLFDPTHLHAVRHTGRDHGRRTVVAYQPIRRPSFEEAMDLQNAGFPVDIVIPTEQSVATLTMADFLEAEDENIADAASGSGQQHDVACVGQEEAGPAHAEVPHVLSPTLPFEAGATPEQIGKAQQRLKLYKTGLSVKQIRVLLQVDGKMAEKIVAQPNNLEGCKACWKITQAAANKLGMIVRNAEVPEEVPVDIKAERAKNKNTREPVDGATGKGKGKTTNAKGGKGSDRAENPQKAKAVITLLDDNWTAPVKPIAEFDPEVPGVYVVSDAEQLKDIAFRARASKTNIAAIYSRPIELLGVKTCEVQTRIGIQRDGETMVKNAVTGHLHKLAGEVTRKADVAPPKQISIASPSCKTIVVVQASLDLEGVPKKEDWKQQVEVFDEMIRNELGGENVIDVWRHQEHRKWCQITCLIRIKQQVLSTVMGRSGVSIAWFDTPRECADKVGIVWLKATGGAKATLQEARTQVAAMKTPQSGLIRKWDKYEDRYVYAVRVPNDAMGAAKAELNLEAGEKFFLQNMPLDACESDVVSILKDLEWEAAVVTDSRLHRSGKKCTWTVSAATPPPVCTFPLKFEREILQVHIKAAKRDIKPYKKQSETEKNAAPTWEASVRGKFEAVSCGPTHACSAGWYTEPANKERCDNDEEMDQADGSKRRRTEKARTEQWYSAPKHASTSIGTAAAQPAN